jgi:hypothetical protein
MSFYNMIFGQNQHADQLLAVLGLTRQAFYRFRDCYLTDGGEIAVYTRGGGGNRNCWYCEKLPADAKSGDVVKWDAGTEYERDVQVHEVGGELHRVDCVVSMQDANGKHPCYLRDQDDDFDNTYATFYFRVPELADREALAGIQPEIARNDAWVTFLDALTSSTKQLGER